MAIVEVIRYHGSPDVFAWKYPNNELGTWTQLIVHESQEAFLLKGGKICDVFQAGRHTLSTENIPILNKLMNLPFGGRSPFTAEVWYVNKVFSMDIKWGTPTPIQLQDPKYKVFVPVRAFGQFGIQIQDARSFLLKLAGDLPEFDKASILKYFRGVYLTKAKDAISSYLVHRNVSILQINAYLDDISAFLQERMEPVFAEYGIHLTSFYVNDINVPEEDSAVQQLKNALAKRAEMDIVGYSYQQERSFNTLEGMAANSKGIQSHLVGAGVGGTLGRQFADLSHQISTIEKSPCPKCGRMVDKAARFCSFCGCDTARSNRRTDRITCSACGAVLSGNSRFCVECGKKYNPCGNCRADIPEGASSCPGCGAAVPKACPNCGKPVPANSKFCPECGFSMVKKCPACGRQLEQSGKFCPECGMAIR